MIGWFELLSACHMLLVAVRFFCWSGLGKAARVGCQFSGVAFSDMLYSIEHDLMVHQRHPVHLAILFFSQTLPSDELV